MNLLGQSSSCQQIHLIVVIPIHKDQIVTNQFWDDIRLLMTKASNTKFVFLVKTNRETHLKNLFTIKTSFNDIVSLFVVDENEYLWNSVLRIETEEGQWVMQIHADDSFEGALNPSSDWSQDTVIDFIPSSSSRVKSYLIGRKSPPPSAFRAIPHRLWCLCQSISQAMSNNVAPSMDHVVNELIKLNGKRYIDVRFSYYYRARNWSRFNRRRRLRKLMVNDVWAGYPLEMAIINRNLDVLCAYHFAFKHSLIFTFANITFPYLGAKPFGVATQIKLYSIYMYYVITLRLCSLCGVTKSSIVEKKQLLGFIIDLSRTDWEINSLTSILQNFDIRFLNDLQRERISFWAESLEAIKKRI